MSILPYHHTPHFGPNHDRGKDDNRVKRQSRPHRISRHRIARLCLAAGLAPRVAISRTPRVLILLFEILGDLQFIEFAVQT